MVRDNAEDERYELVVDGDVVGELQYRVQGDRIALTHTEVQPALEGQGLGSRLVAGALDDIRPKGLKVVPVCSFVAAFVQRHPEYADLVA